MLPLKKRGTSSAPRAPSENELHWERGAEIPTFKGFRSFATSQPSPTVDVPGLDGPCGAPSSAHVLTAELHREAPEQETIYVTTHGIVAISQGQVVAATEPPTDCANLASEIVVAHAGFWSRGTSFPQNENRLVVLERVGTQVRQRLFYHWPKGRLTESFSWIIEDSTTPDVKRKMSANNDGDHIITETGPFHWVAAEARFVPGAKRNRATRKAF